MERRTWEADELSDLAILTDEQHVAKWGRTEDAVRLARKRKEEDERKAFFNPDKKQSVLAIMSDSHIGKKTDTYNTAVAAQRIARFGQALDEAQMRRGISNDSELVILLLGDMVDGEGIYPTQHNHQDITNVETQANTFANLLTAFVRARLNKWGSIRIEAISGNHGRAGKSSHEAANWDSVAYRFLQRTLEGTVPVGFNDEHGFFMRRVTVDGFNVLAYHGHEVRASNGNLPISGLSQKALRWANTSLAPFGAIVCGHYHSRGSWQLGSIKLRFNGTLVSSDMYSLERFGWESSNIWSLVGIQDGQWLWEDDVDLSG